jgi:DNA-binding NarL/FixJ family response regulator
MFSTKFTGEPQCPSLILVDHRQLVREAIHRLIVETSDIRVTAHASDGDACLKLVAEIGPDIILCAAQLPRMSGLELASRLRRIAGGPRVVIIGNHDSRTWVVQAVQAGASAILTQRDNAAELVAAIAAARDDRLYLSPIANALYAAAGTEERPALTLRQREILQLYAEGLGTKEIAWRLDLSIKTVSTHREQILQRLALRSNSDLIRFAIREGMVDP